MKAELCTTQWQVCATTSPLDRDRLAIRQRFARGASWPRRLRERQALRKQQVLSDRLVSSRAHFFRQFYWKSPAATSAQMPQHRGEHEGGADAVERAIRGKNAQPPGADNDAFCDGRWPHDPAAQSGRDCHDPHGSRRGRPRDGSESARSSSPIPSSLSVNTNGTTNAGSVYFHVSIIVLNGRPPVIAAAANGESAVGGLTSDSTA